MDSPLVLTDLNTNKKPNRDQKNNGASFITKMYQILQDPEIQHLVNWNPEGTAFQIMNVLKFSNTVLPKYFKHRNYSSFVRQLNMYGFRKVKSETAESSFTHEMFKRDEASLHKIKRLKMKKNQSEDEDDEHFIEKYSGPRRVAAAKDQPQNFEFKGIQGQLSQLTEKFKIMQDTTNDLRKTVLSQNETIKTLMTELLHARADGEKKFQVLVADLSSRPQNDEVFVEHQEQFLEDTFEPKTKNLNSAGFNRASNQDNQGQKANSTQKSQDYYNPGTVGLDNNIFSDDRGWRKSDSYREFNNEQALAASNKAKSNGNTGLLASREGFTPFDRRSRGRNTINQGKPYQYAGTGNASYESSIPYPYFEKNLRPSQEQSATTNSGELNHYEARKLFPELIQELCDEVDDDHDRFEEEHSQPHKKHQRVTHRNGVHPINREISQSDF